MRAWAILLGLSIIILIGLYKCTRRPLVSALIAAFIAATDLQFLARIELGYFDKFWLIAVAVSFAASFAFSLIVILVWRAFRPRGNSAG